MMHGYKWQLFCMELSFVGWYLLGYLACGVGTLFVVPYQMASYVAFYTTLKDGDSVSEAEREAAVTLAEMRRNNLK
jgi:uncharacterized membrane protein